MSTLLPLTIVGIVAGCIYAVTATGLVVTYTTTGIFNFAHGAMGMIAAFAYWQFSVHWGLPEPVAFLIVLLVVAPLLGAIIERLLMRPLRGRSLDVTLTTTLGLLLFLIGLATVVWDPKKPRIVTQFFKGHTVKLFGVIVTAHQITVVVCAILVAAGLRLFLYKTRPGTALRAVVDNPELTGLTGASPARFGQYGWMIGAMLAALAGMLLAPLITLDIQTLTLLVINGYAAAMVGRLRNLPLTFAGGLALGLTESYLVGYLPVGTWLSQVKPTVPMVFLFVALILVPERRIASRLSSGRLPRVAGLTESVIAGAALVLLAVIVAPHLSPSNLVTASHGVALGLIMLSLVLLVGYGGQISLAQLTFAGVGAFAMGKVSNGHSWWGLLAAIGLSRGGRRTRRSACVAIARPVSGPGDPGLRFGHGHRLLRQPAHLRLERLAHRRPGVGVRTVAEGQQGLSDLPLRRVRPRRHRSGGIAEIQLRAPAHRLGRQPGSIGHPRDEPDGDQAGRVRGGGRTGRLCRAPSTEASRAWSERPTSSCSSACPWC